jgi:hypothetical protein
MSLKEKLEKINKVSSLENVDIEKVKQEWFDRVNTLYTQTKDWFKSYITDGLFVIVEKDKKINEEHLGSYTIIQLEYEFGEHSLVFEPMGRNILGAWGRIDVYLRGSKSDRYMLILLGEKFDSADWILSSFQDKSIRIPLNKENLEKIIENWIDTNSPIL